MATTAQSIEKAHLRIKTYRKTDALQRLLEEQLFLLAQKPHLQPGQAGYVEGEETPNPLYQEMTPSTRLSMRLSLARELRSHLPLREAEQRVDELEAQLGELLQVIQTNAPYLLQGNVGGGNGQSNLH